MAECEVIYATEADGPNGFVSATLRNPAQSKLGAADQIKNARTNWFFRLC
jgi:hypothetical protein